MTNRILAIAAAAAIASATAYAADIIIEAENPTESLEWVVSEKNSENSEVSGKKGLALDNVHRDNYALYRFEAPAAGTYHLTAYYVTMNTRWFMVKLNDSRPRLVRIGQYSANWDGTPGEGEDPAVASVSVDVYCNEGENVLELKGVYGQDEPFAPMIDRFELTKAEEDAEAETWSYTANHLTVECENFESRSGSAGDSNNKPPFSGSKGLGFGNSAGQAVYAVEVVEEGSYLLEFSYATMQDRWFNVAVGRQNTSQNILVSKYSQGWGNDEGEWLGRRGVIVYLEKGLNKIYLNQLNSFSPDFDKFTVDRVDLNFEFNRPEILKAMHKASLADAAKWTSGSFDKLAALNDHDENTVVKAKSAQASLQLEFPSAVLVSGYAIAAPAGVEGWTVSVSADGENWTAISGAEMRETYSDESVHTFVLDTRSEAVKYVSLAFEGEEAPELADFAVFGNFESPLEGGLIPVGHSDFESTHPGFDSGWGEVVANLFDGNVNRQFTVAEGGDGSMGDADDIAVTVYLAEELPVASYLLATHNSTGYYKTRSPREWTLEAFDYEANDWRTVSDCKDMNFVAPASSLIMVAEPAATSDTWRLTLKNRRGKATHLSMFQLYADNKLDVEEKDNGGTTSVAEAPVAASVAVSGNVVSLAAANSAYAVYTVSGAVVSRGTIRGTVSVELPAGLYIVKVANRVSKVAIR